MAIVAVVGSAVMMSGGLMGFAQPEKKPAGAAQPAEKSKEQPKKDAAQPGQPTPEELAQWEAAATPGEFHKHLDVMAGEWNYKMKMQPAPGAPAMEDSGTQKNAWILGGRHLSMSTTGNFMGMPFEGFGTWGYDNVKKKYISTWMDTTMTGVMPLEGTCDGAGKVFTLTGEFSDPTGNMIKCREVTTIKGDDSYVMVMHMSGPDGADMGSMEIAYTRKAGTTRPAPAKAPAKPAGR